MSLVELKAQAYDLLAQIQECQNKLVEINRLIAKEIETEQTKK